MCLINCPGNPKYLSYSQSRQKQNSSLQSTTQLGSTLSGGSIVAIAGRDLSVQASNLVGDADIALVAARDVSIVSAQDTRDSASDSSSKKSGLIGSAWQPALGTVKTTEDGTSSSVTQVGSQVGSIGGNVSIQAGERYTQTASGVMAPSGDIDIRARDVSIEAGYDTADSNSHNTYSKVALGGSVSVPLVNAVQGMMGLASAAKEAGGGRMSALAAMTAASDAVDTVQQISQNGLSTGIKVSVSLGSTKSESNVVQTSSTSVGSQVAAGGDVSIVATGGGKSSNITAIGSEISAGGNATLRADNAVNLLAAENTFSQHSTNSSSGASIGIGFAFGGAQQGFTLDLAASKSKGRADGEELSHTNTQVSAGGKVSLQSGGDTTLKGAVVTAETVQAAVGGDLMIESLQDRATYDSKQASAGVNLSLCIPPFCYGASTVGGHFSKSTVNGDFQSVAQQSGIKAGDGGFQVSVGGLTDLIGGVVSSSQAAIDEKKNSLATGSLTYSSLQNKDVYKGSGLSLSGSLSKNGKDYSQSMAPGSGQVSGTQGSVTRSGVSEGVLTVGDQQAGQTVVNLARDVVTGKETAQAITKGWDGTQVMNEVNAEMQITSTAMPRLANAIGTYAETKVKVLNKQDNPEEAAKWAEGGIYRVAAHTALGALGGGLNGAVGAAAASGAAPTVQKLQDALQAELADAGLSDNAAKSAAKLIAGGAAGAIGGVAGGGAGAATGLNADANNRQLHREEKSLAAKLAAQSKGKYTTDQIEAALRASDNTKLGEDITKGMVVPLTAATTANELYDTAGMVLTKDEAGRAFLVQQIQSQVSPDLAGYIRSSTGAANSPYVWEPSILGIISAAPSPSNVNPFTTNSTGCITAECAAGVAPNRNHRAGETQFFGGLQATGGAAQTLGGSTLVATGLTSCIPSSGVGCVVAAFGAFQMLAGIDNVNTGTKTVMDAKPHMTTGEEILQQAGLSRTAGGLLYGGLQLGTGYGAIKLGTTRGIFTTDVPEAITLYGTTVSEEVASLRNLAKNNGGVIPGPGERGLTRVEYDTVMSQYRNMGPALQNALDNTISGQPYVYRATTLDAVNIYRNNGFVAGRSGGTFMSTEYVGTDIATIMDRGQVFHHWGEPQVLLRIPTSQLSSAVVPRPLGNKLSVGWEPRTLFYPKAGSGGQNQFLGTTKTWDDSWVVPLLPKKGP